MSLPSRDGTIEAWLPRLASGYSWCEIASPPDPRYNCMAFAMGDTTKRWAPTKGETAEHSYWPFEPLEDHLSNFLAVFESEGYRQCEHEKPEEGLDKVAIFLNDWGLVAHVAFQPAGADYWLSKLCEGYDIKHEKVDAVSGSLYGWPDIFLSRPSDNTS